MWQLWSKEAFCRSSRVHEMSGNCGALPQLRTCAASSRKRWRSLASETARYDILFPRQVTIPGLERISVWRSNIRCHVEVLRSVSKPRRRTEMKNLIACLLGVIVVVLQPTGVVRAASKDKDEDRLKDCGAVLKEILDIPDDIPQGLLDKADCVVVYPSVLKAAFVVGGSYGRGAMTCRQGEDFRGSWGAPTMMGLWGGRFGFQIGGQATDFVLLVMNEGGARGILAGKVKLGGEASVAAGPV